MSRKKLFPSEADLRASVSATSWLDDCETAPAASVVESVPEGWLTLKEMAKMKGIPVSTMNHRVKNNVAAGIWQRKQFRIRTDRQVTDVWHYTKA